MFKSILEYNGKYIIRRWTIIRLEYLNFNSDHWYGIDFIDHATTFETPELAREAYKIYKEKKDKHLRFVQWL